MMVMIVVATIREILVIASYTNTYNTKYTNNCDNSNDNTMHVCSRVRLLM